jgi:hypothetical protein
MKIAQLAVLQQGLVTRAQLLGIGAPAPRVGGDGCSARCGPGALLSHDSAAALGVALFVCAASAVV